MKVYRNPRHADRIMRIEGALAIAGVGGGILLWSAAAHFPGYEFAGAAFLGLGGIQSGIRALRNYNRYHRGADGEQAALSALHALPEAYWAVTNFVVPGTRQGDADLLILGPFGVLVIEVKSYTGHYACHGDAWFHVRDDGTRQPLRSSVSRQLKRNRKAIQHYLVDCDLAAPVHAAAVFGPATRLDVVQPTVPLLRMEDLCGYALQLPACQPPVTAAGLAHSFVTAPAPSPALPGHRPRFSFSRPALPFCRNSGKARPGE